MRPPAYAVVLEREGSILQDRVRVIEAGGGLVIAVADGAGGLSGSERAAEAVVQGIESKVSGRTRLEEESSWVEWLEEIDSTILQAGTWGETTAVALAVTDRWICGASVGDSEVWLATPDDFRSLTDGQRRRPFLGSGSAMPVSFLQQHSGGTLVVGTDGLFKYAPAWRICQLATAEPPEVAARNLLDLIRLPNGKWQDDVGFVVCQLATV